MLSTPSKKEIKPITDPPTHKHGQFPVFKVREGRNSLFLEVFWQCQTDLDLNFGERFPRETFPFSWRSRKSILKWRKKNKNFIKSSTSWVSRWRINTHNSYLPSFLSTFIQIFGLSHIKKSLTQEFQTIPNHQNLQSFIFPHFFLWEKVSFSNPPATQNLHNPNLSMFKLILAPN